MTMAVQNSSYGAWNPATLYTYKCICTVEEKIISTNKDLFPSRKICWNLGSDAQQQPLKKTY